MKPVSVLMGKEGVVHEPANNTAYNPGEASATGGALATW